MGTRATSLTIRAPIGLSIMPRRHTAAKRRKGPPPKNLDWSRLSADNGSGWQDVRRPWFVLCQGMRKIEIQ
jgi:hypothetical protein